MKIGIVGGGVIGLVCGYLLSKNHQVTIIKKEELGGLTSSFKINNTYLEKYYHHFFTNDQNLTSLLKELELGERIVFEKTKMAFFHNNKIHHFSTVKDLLKFQPLKLIERLKLGLMMFYLGKKRNWKAMDNINIKKWVSKNFGQRIYKLIWQPLLRGKFGNNQENISAAWLWGRIHPRYNSRKMGKEKLGYIMGSFRELFLKIEREIKSNKGNFIKKEVKNISSVKDKKIQITTTDNSGYIFDKVIFTPALPIFIKTIRDLPTNYINKLQQIKYQSIICLCLRLKKKVSDIYWLNISDSKTKISGLIEHTNFIDEKTYNANILYVFRYLDARDKDYQSSSTELFKSYCQEIKKIFPEFDESWVESFHFAKDQYATPIFNVGYSKQIPSFATPMDNLYLITMAQIYPDDRNINNSIGLVRKAFKIIQHSQEKATHR